MENKSRHVIDEEDESFFVSMTDIMVGLLFIFIILVAYFAIQVRVEINNNLSLQARLNEVSDPEGVRQRARMDAYREVIGEERTRIVLGLEEALDNAGFNAAVDLQHGILRLPEGVLFGSGDFSIERGSDSDRATTALALGLAQVLPCSVLQENGRPYASNDECGEKNNYHAYVEAIYVEGHTDNDPILGERGLLGDTNLNTNLKLSARRSTNTYEAIIRYAPEILNFYGPNVDTQETQRVLATAGYGETRPITPNETIGDKAENRRIDIRVLMYQPRDNDSYNELMTQIGEEVITPN